MNNSFILYFILIIFVTSLKGVAQEKQEIFFADPTIFVENNTYYLTGTKNREPLGFAILESEDLQEWKVPTEDSLYMILNKGKNNYGSQGFWAPQIIKHDNQFLLTHTANEQTVLTRSHSLMGPFVQKNPEPIDGSEKNIDSYLFKDSDGKFYLYHVRFNKGNYIWVAEFDIRSGKIKSETLSKCFDQTESWEATPNYKSNPIMEGPTVIKLKDIYYMFYSANHFRNIDYAVGYATSNSPYGPWQKHKNNPIIHRSIVGENGSGHGDIFEGLDGKKYYVYHIHHSDSEIIPRRVRIVPLKFEWDESMQLFNITVDSNSIIKPYMVVK